MATSKRVHKNWIKALSEQNEKDGKCPEGEGWSTFHELIAEHNLGQNKLRKMLSNGVASGPFEAFKGSRPKVTGRLTRCVWYRPI